jgi:hypothetical protein
MIMVEPIKLKFEFVHNPLWWFVMYIGSMVMGYLVSWYYTALLFIIGLFVTAYITGRK